MISNLKKLPDKLHLNIIRPPIIKFRYLSDLHLEFIKPDKIYKFIEQIKPSIDEICILAGDIGNPRESNYNIFMDYINHNFKKSFVIPGNHEYYNSNKYTIQQTNDFMTEYFIKLNNISFLNNSYEHYNGYCFVGTTLWSHITKPEYKINDVYSIPYFDSNQYNELNKLSVNFLEQTLENNENCVVITHHQPSESLIDEKYLTTSMMPYNQWFYCNMDSLIETKKDKIKCWFYGHTHTSSKVVKNGIPFLCNPIGYRGENKNLDFQSTFTLF